MKHFLSGLSEDGIFSPWACMNCLDRQAGVSSSILQAGILESVCFPLWCHHIPKAQEGEKAAIRGLVELSEEHDTIC